jgi:PAS domain S-box-containing protein
MMPSEASSTEEEVAALRARLCTLEGELAAARGRAAALEESQAHYRLLAEDSLVGVYALQDHKFVFVNRTSAALFGARPEDLIGKDFAPFMLPESLPVVEENIRRRLAGEVSTAHYTTRIRTLQGEIRDIEVLGTIATFDGRPAIIGTAIDRTGDVAARNALQEQTRLLKLILECMGDGVAVSNSDGEFIIFNPAGIRITGVGPTDAPPSAWGEAYGLFRPDRMTPFPPC